MSDPLREEDLLAVVADPDALLRVPLATYRLQLGPGLTFDDASGLVPYLATLGISDCYTSPFFETSSNRSHGYDISDHNRFRMSSCTVPPRPTPPSSTSTGCR